MDQPRAKLRTVFDQAAELDRPAERQAFLDRACGGDTALRAEVESLLRAHGHAGTFLSGRPALDALDSEAWPIDATDSLDTTAGREELTERKERLDPALAFLAAPTRPGTVGRLGHYDILEVLGRGGMGTVLKAFDDKLHRVVAIKALAAELAGNATSRKRFVREAQAAAAVSNDHLVTLHAVEADHAPPYLVMQFIDGQSLQAVLDRRGPLGTEEVVRIAVQVATGLAAAHQHGLTHRDVKPSNILLEGPAGRVKLSDFGLARAADDDHLTQTGIVAGTPLYMSPEQAEGHTVDHRSDLFSLGSVLYAMCTGAAPFAASSSVAVMRRVCDDAPRPIRQINPAIPEWLVALIARLHAKAPAERIQSAAEVSELLRGRLAEMQAPPPAVAAVKPQDAPRPVRRRGWAIAAGVAAALVAGLGVAEMGGVTDFRGTVVEAMSPEGTLVIEVSDPEVSVALEGGEVRITGAGAKEVRLRPGEYKLKATKDGKLLRQELVTITRGGRQVVKVLLLPPPEAKAVAAPAVKPPVDWMRTVAALPAEKQLAAVVARLRELNPGFDGKVDHRIEDDAVVELKMRTEKITNVTPIRALQGLRSLTLDGGYPNATGGGKLADLRPLRGLALTHLDVSRNQVADLAPLRGMPLMTLGAYFNPLKSLAPLADMPLIRLNFGTTEVTDLRPLAGLPLRTLACPFTPVADLAPLAGLRLTILNIIGTRVADLGPLRGMPLSSLSCSDIPAADLSPLRGLPITTLDCSDLLSYDPAPLRSLPLQRVWIKAPLLSDDQWLRAVPSLREVNRQPVATFWKERDAARAALAQWSAGVAKMTAADKAKAVEAKLHELNPHAGARVTYNVRGGNVDGFVIRANDLRDASPLRALGEVRALTIAVPDGSPVGTRCRLADLTPLKGMKVMDLFIRGTAVHDLSPLAGMPLTRLHCGDTYVKDLSPLRGMKLQALQADQSPVADLTPLSGMPLTALYISSTRVSDLAPVRAMKLTEVALSNTPIRDLSPLRGMPLRLAYLHSMHISDSSILKGAPLEELSCVFEPWRDTEPLRAIKTLKMINAKPAATFWAEQAAVRASFDAWCARVAKMTPKEQVEEVARKLRLRNSTFDGKIDAWKAEGDVVRLIAFNTDHVADISPLRALSSLQSLTIPGTALAAGTPQAKGNGLLKNLAPLRGMRLTVLKIDYNQIADLEPLRGMPLAALGCRYNPVSDLSPLKNAPLISLDIAATRVTDLSAVPTAKLNTLTASLTAVTDLSPLRDAPLDLLSLDSAQVTRLPVFTKKRLRVLSIQGAPLTDLTPLRGQPLQDIYLPFNPWRDAAVLRSFRTLKMINRKPAVVFWKEQAAIRAAFELWCASVTKMKPTDQAKAVEAKLRQLNPRLDATFHTRLTDGQVTQFFVVGRGLTDISPVRALPALRELRLQGPFGPERCELADLSPLKGLSLLLLSVRRTEVRDLSPLRGMRLDHLDCGTTNVTDLSPVREMRTLEYLSCGETPIADLSPVTGHPLRSLLISGSRIADLSPVRGMELNEVSLANTPIRDLSPLRDMPLKVAYLQSMHVADRSVLKGAPFEELTCDFEPWRDTEPLQAIKTLKTINSKPAATFWKEQAAVRAAFERWCADVARMKPKEQIDAVAEKLRELNPKFDGKLTHRPLAGGAGLWIGLDTSFVTDISPVRAFPGLKQLFVSPATGLGPRRTSQGALKNLWPLRGLALTDLDCSHNRIDDLEPLRGMPLTLLRCSNNPIRDLTPLANAPLTDLSIQATQVSDLAPVSPRRLKFLNAALSPVADLSPLREAPLEQLWVARTKVTALPAFTHKTLKFLDIQGTAIADLTPVKGQPLTMLDYGNAKITDVSPLRGMPLQDIHCTFDPKRDAAVLRSFRTLKRINRKPAVVFWKEVAAR